MRTGASRGIGAASAVVADACLFAGEELVSLRAKQPLLALARNMPRVIRSFGFECRLEAGDDRVDLGIAVAPENGGRAALVAIGAGDSASRSLESDERWLRIGRFARAWGVSGRSLRSWVSFVFLEFDEQSASDPHPVPSIFLGLDSRLEGSSGASPELRGAQSAASILGRKDEASAVSARLGRAFAALPEGGRVLHLGVMLGRPGESVRLSVLMPGSEAAPFLRRLDLPAAAEIAEATHGKLSDLLALAQLDFDLGPGGSERIGFGLRPIRPGPSAWPDLLDRLSGLVALSGPKCDALLRWPGSQRTLGQRDISHVKLACGAGSRFQLKAYLGVTPWPSR